MMARYVDIDDIIKTFEKLHGEESTLINCYNADWIVSFIEAQPTADVAEVIRCKDCAVPHNQWTGCPKLNGIVTPPDFYCSCGERRKGDGKIH